MRILWYNDINMDFFVFPIAVVVLFFLVFQLRGRVRRLEKLVAGEKESIQAVPVPSPISSLPSSPDIPNSIPKRQASGPSPLLRFGAWLKEDWLLKLGAFLFLIGLGWFASYAFLHNWIGPMGRIALGITASVLILLLGFWRARKYTYQGSVFLVLGSTGILLTLFGARQLYGFFSPWSVLLIMFLSTAFVGLASVKYRVQWLSVASVILAGIAPLLTNNPTPHDVQTFSYLFAVVLGALWVVALTGWRSITLWALLLTACYSVPHIFSFSSQRGVLLLFAYAFAALFFITNTLGIVKAKEGKSTADLFVAAGNGLLLLLWIMSAVSPEWRSLVIAAWMVVFAVGAFLTLRITGRHEPFVIYGGVSVAMLAAATAAELHGAALTIAYTLESGILAFLAYILLRDVRLAERTSFLLVGPIVLSFSSIQSSSWVNAVIHKDFFVLAALTLTLFGLGLFFSWVRSREKGMSGSSESNVSSLLIIAGSLYAYLLLWLSLHAALLNDNLAVMASLLVYTVVGLITYFYGKMQSRRFLRLYGGALLGFVVVRLLTVDVWQMALTNRIITFFVVGALLMSTAFIGRTKKTTALPKG